MNDASPTGARPTAARVASVLLALPLPEAFDYAEPPGLELAIGDIVEAPLGRTVARGVVTALRDATGVNRELKPVLAKLPEPPLPPTTLAFVEWAAHYAVDSAGLPLAMALRGLRAPRPEPELRLVAHRAPEARDTPARRRVLEAAIEPIRRADLRRAADVGDGVIKALVESGALGSVLVERRHAPPPPLGLATAPELNPSQAAAAKALSGAVAEAAFSVSLLDGITGSGKTEVYLEAAAAALALRPGAQALILLPEIALTPAVLERVKRRFGAPPTAWHSGMTPPARRRVWETVASGEARIVVGARSALFLPFHDLALIIVDEEHDGSYKQEEGFIYQARDLAVARGKIEGCAVVLVSATPSLETLWNARAGRYRWLRLSDRHGAAELPDIRLLDLRAHPPPPGRWLSPPLVEEIGRTLERGEQTLLFLNRRGYAPAGAVPGVRRAAASAGHRLLAGRASLQRPAGLPPHRLLHAQAGALPLLRGAAQPDVDRPRRGAGGGGGEGAVSQRASRALLVRHPPAPGRRPSPGREHVRR